MRMAWLNIKGASIQGLVIKSKDWAVAHHFVLNFIHKGKGRECAWLSRPQAALHEKLSSYPYEKATWARSTLEKPLSLTTVQCCIQKQKTPFSYQQKVQRLAYVMVCGCINVHGMDDLNMCEDATETHAAIKATHFPGKRVDIWAGQYQALFFFTC